MTPPLPAAAASPAPLEKVPEAALAPGVVPRDPRLKRFHDYWLGKCGGRPMPARRDIDPVDFPYLLGNVMLIEVLREPLRFRVRLHGTNVVARMHYDMTGRFLDEVPRPEWRAYVIERCRGLAASGAPLLLMNDLMLDGWTSRYEALWVPLGEDGTQVDMLMCAMIYGELGPAAPAAPGPSEL
ncbi:MAG TPA: PAS domain-containing protein [Stellaceae bacterium]|nr:PAS domain-containing protein [Stellaceae bacterium]